MQVQEINQSIRLRNQESKQAAASENPWIKGLNTQQAAAVSFLHDDGAVLVLAGAGSGKTTVLTRRIAQLYSEKSRESRVGVEPRGILALTFTKDAAQEMSHRLKSLLGFEKEPEDFPIIGTFHAFAYRMIRAVMGGIPNWRRLGFFSKPELIELDAKKAWLSEVRQSWAPEYSIEQILAWLIDPFEEKTESKARDEIRNRYRTFLYQNDKVGFDDMVGLALKLFQMAPEVLAEFQSRTKYILVDEFQDTSRDQLELVRVLMGKSHNLFLVGDDDQAIYGFRGANPGNIDAALKSFPGMQILKLETNYRSTKPIVNFANSVFSHKAKQLRKRLIAGQSYQTKSNSIPVRKVNHQEGAHQAEWLAAELKRLNQAEGLAWKEIALIYRINVLEAYYRSVVEKLVGLEAAQEIVLSTVHAAKGLEYPAVFFVGLEEGVLPYQRRGEILAPERLAEERRIFYVGVTRAQRFLYLCSVRKRMLRGKQIESEVSRFLHGPVRRIFRRLTGKG